MARLPDLVPGLADIFRAAGGTEDLILEATLAGGAAGAHAGVTGIAVGDVILAVTHIKADVMEIIAGGAAGAHVATPHATRVFTALDTLTAVWHDTAGTIVDLTSEFRALGITGTSTIDNTAGSSTAADNLWIFVKRSPTSLTTEFSITAASTVDNTGGTVTTGDQIHVIWMRK